jgi:DGQHR domain-containing protein
MRRSRSQTLNVTALRVEQRPGVPLYLFGVDGRAIHHFAAVDPAERTSEGVLRGYQRERVARHIAEIFQYLTTENALLPNAIVLAFDERVNFVPEPGAIRNEWGTPGQLSIPVPELGEAKPAFIVDGQQRVSALAQLDTTRQFPLFVVAFVSDSAELSREQFVLVNKTKPLPRDLLNELLPHIDAELPKPWRLRRIAASVLEVLRYDRESPFYGRIRGVGGAGPGYNISQASVLNIIETSIRRGGVLSLYAAEGEEVDAEGMARVVSVFFEGVRRVWRYAWNENPWTSRLVHGVGVAAMGRLMDVVMKEVNASSPRAASSVERRLRGIEGRCAWTEGNWPVLGVAWDELENTGRDKRRLAEYLIKEYERAADVSSRVHSAVNAAGNDSAREVTPSVKSDGSDQGLDEMWSEEDWTKKRSCDFDDVPLALVTPQLAVLITEESGLSEDNLADNYSRRFGIGLGKKRRRMLERFAWSAKGRGLVDHLDGRWVPGRQNPGPDPRWHHWTVEELKKRAGGLLAGGEDPFEELLAEVRTGRRGRVPKLMMSVVGTAVNEARSDFRE